jgi:leucine dehydrogenase
VRVQGHHRDPQHHAGPGAGRHPLLELRVGREAIVDALRLAGMTYKAAVAGLNLGGGKSVIIGDPKTTPRG